jgi:hypothetical protein
MNTVRKLALALLVIPLLLSANPVLAGDEQPAGTIVIDEVQVMALIGGELGGGTLLLGDKSYSFKTGGIKIGGIGMHSIHLVGDVYRLKNVADFPGTYLAANVGITVVKGVGGMWLQNDKGVAIHLRANAEGVALNLGVEGLEITME